MGLAVEPPAGLMVPTEGDAATGETVHDEPDEQVADALQRPAAQRRRFGGRAEPGVLCAIAVGGGMGTLARYGVSRVIHVAKDTFPWATFTTNLTGAFALGLFLTLVLERFPPTRFPRPFFAIGFLGAFTTFSTMAVETVTLCRDGEAVLGIGYLAASVACGLAACYLGIVLARISPFGADTAPR
jgi:CrcB protein